MSLTADAADGKTGYQSSADARGRYFCGESENVCVRTSLICSGGHQSAAAAVAALLRNKRLTKS